MDIDPESARIFTHGKTFLWRSKEDEPRSVDTLLNACITRGCGSSEGIRKPVITEAMRKVLGRINGKISDYPLTGELTVDTVVSYMDPTYHLLIEELIERELPARDEILYNLINHKFPMSTIRCCLRKWNRVVSPRSTTIFDALHASWNQRSETEHEELIQILVSNFGLYDQIPSFLYREAPTKEMTILLACHYTRARHLVMDALQCVLPVKDICLLTFSYVTDSLIKSDK
jgi:hypothetical protein